MILRGLLLVIVRVLFSGFFGKVAIHKYRFCLAIRHLNAGPFSLN